MGLPAAQQKARPGPPATPNPNVAQLSEIFGLPLGEEFLAYRHFGSEVMLVQETRRQLDVAFGLVPQKAGLETPGPGRHPKHCSRGGVYSVGR